MSRWMLLPALLVLAGVAAACNPGDVDNIRSTGSYPIDIFQEMHYNQSFKSQEPPRLSPAQESVPWRGFAEVASTNVEEFPFVKEATLPRLRIDAAALPNPVPQSAAALERAADLFIVNCSMCHGRLADAEAGADQPLFVGRLFGDYRIVQPPSFDSDRVQALSPGEAFWSITNGIGFMPSFANLLNPDARWHVTHLLSMDPAERSALLGDALERSKTKR